MNGTQVCYPIEAMDDLLLTCACGGLTPVSSYAIGQNTKCANCGAVVTITEMNIRPRTEPKREIGPPADDEEEVSPVFHVPRPSHEPVATEEVKAFQPDPESEVRLFLDDEEETRRTSGQPVHVTASPEPSREKRAPPPVERCTRCGRAFRGDWDRVEEFDGVVCHVCANKIQNLPAGMAPARPTVMPGSIMREVARQLSWSLPEPGPASGDLSGAPDRKRRREMIVLAILAVLAITIVCVWPTQQGSSPTTASSSAPEAELPSSVFYLLLGMSAVFSIAVYAVTIYATLNFAQKLPNETLLANLVAVSLVAVLVWALSFLPFAGFILGIALVYALYDLTFGHLFMFIIFRILAGILISALEKLVFGAMGLLLS